MCCKISVSLVILAAFIQGSNGCDGMKFVDCGTDFTKMLFRSIFEKTLDHNELCSHFKTLERCIGSSPDDCGINGPMVWQVFTDGFDYVCSDDGKAYPSTHCKEQKVVYYACYVKAYSDFGYDLGSIDDMEWNGMDVCKPIETFTKCMADALPVMCGRKDTLWFAGLFDAMFKSPNAFLKCNFKMMDFLNTGKTNDQNKRRFDL